MKLNSQKVQAATQAMMSAIDDYCITVEGIPDLINVEEINDAIITAMVAFCRDYIDTANTIDSLKTDQVVRKAFSQLVISLRNRVYTGKLKPTLANNNVTYTPITKSPNSGLNYYDQIIKLVTGQIVDTWQPKTPTLIHKPDAVRFLEICRDLFPNVVDPCLAANAFREFIENVHYSCGTPGAKFEQKALWLYSYRTGGTGKSFFLKMLKKACDELGIDAAYEILKDDGFMKPTVGMHTVTICGDTQKLNSNLAETVNNLIDQEEFHYNIKYGSTGNKQSFANLVVGSNYVSFELNTRRYNEVEYVQCNLKTALTKQERASYFPLWDNEAKCVAAIVQAFEVCPFQCEYDSWEQPIINNDLFTEEPKQTLKVNVRNIQLLLNIKDTIDTITAITNTPTILSNEYKMRPTEFARLMDKYHIMKYDTAYKALIPFLTELKTNRMLPSRNCEGRTPIELSRFDWDKIADMIPSADETETNFLATIRDEWNALIDEALKTRKEVI